MESHSCPHALHSHHALRLLAYATVSGVSSPLRVGCHSAAAWGKRSANELPGFGKAFVTLLGAGGGSEATEGERPRSARPRAAYEHGGHCAPVARLPIDACHSCPQFAHSHQALSFREKATSAGVRSPFRVGCHSAAADGFLSASELPGFGMARALLAHFLQDAPAERFDTCTCHSLWQRWHRHHTFLLLA